MTAELAYSADGQVATRKAKNSTTGDQTTTYVYGVTTTAGSREKVPDTFSEGGGKVSGTFLLLAPLGPREP